jgi:hypothetical protein
MSENVKVKETCIQEPCFFLPFFEAGEWRVREKSPWKQLKRLKQEEATPEHIQALADYTGQRISRCAEMMTFLLSIHDHWDVTVKKDGVYMETEAMIYEDILPRIKEAGFSENDYVLYSEYTRKWGML